MALSGIKPPDFDWSSTNLPETWQKFRQHADLIFAGPLSDKDEVVQRTYILLWIGQKGRDVYSTWTFSEDNVKLLKPLYDKFEKYVQPKANPIFARYKFNNITQGSDTFDEFVTKLRIAAKDCDYKPDSNDMIRDRIVFGINTQKLREKLLNVDEDKLTLDKAVQLGQSYEYAQSQMKQMSKPEQSPATPVHAVTKGRNSNGPRSEAGTRPQKQTYGRQQTGHSHYKQQQRDQQRRPPSTQNSGHMNKQCDNCGYEHKEKNNYKCPAQGQQCLKCSKWNHFASKCRSTASKGNRVASVSVQNGDETELFDDFFVDVINTNRPKPHDQAFVDLKVGPRKNPISFKLDTGAPVNVIPSHIFHTACPSHTLSKPAKHLSSYNGTPIKTIGCCNLQIEYKDKCTISEIYVAEGPSTPILGLPTCLDLQLIQLIYAVDQKPIPSPDTKPLDKDTVLSDYADVFKGIGQFPGNCTIHVDPEIQPIVNPPRRIPIALRDKLKAELDRMEMADIIAKVNAPTPWVNSLVVVEKSSGKLRVCLDPQHLNKAIQRPHYPMKTLEEILPDLNGAKYFTKLDARSGYWALKLDDQSSLLTTFNTPYGRYRFLRMPFGIQSAQDEFQRVIDHSYEGLTGVNAIVDDILVHGNTRAEHDQNLRAVLDRSRAIGIKLNNDKLEVGVTSVRYFGHMLTDNGVGADPEKVSAVHRMQPPKDKGELETILGLINYLAKFAPNLSEITSPMRDLLPRNVEFIWDSHQAAAFEKVKNLITQSPILAYFDPNSPVTLQVDASKIRTWCHTDAKPEACCLRIKVLDPDRGPLRPN